MIAKALAIEAKAVLFQLSPSSIVKWGEDTVHALFAVAQCSRPAVVFLEDIDALLPYLRCWDNWLADQILVIGSTSRPEQLDAATLIRFRERWYIPLPTKGKRVLLLKKFLQNNEICTFTDEEIEEVSSFTEGYSVEDIISVIHMAAVHANQRAGRSAVIQYMDCGDALIHSKPRFSEEEISSIKHWMSSCSKRGEEIRLFSFSEKGEEIGQELGHELA
ncbi:putative microtubule-severing ATPase [Rosa chinensis]|uniref:Putative microtubule-severing ATPase n=1 Tax=Rosa chinensis TaxID=74649 RepID=A0A2P6RGY0_ROSCH|nr:putative microtubule-severing ATPase [Rosa chinensis]